MPRIRFNGQNFEVPEQVNGQQLNNILNPSQDEIPVMVGKDGGYQPINDHDEYHIDDETQVDGIHALRNG